MTKPRVSVSISLADRGRPEMWANEAESAVLCGMSPERFRERQSELAQDGFPPTAPLNGKRFIPHILAWCERKAAEAALPTDPKTLHDAEVAKERTYVPARTRRGLAVA